MSNEDDIARVNRIISPLVKNGQSLHQIYLDHVDELMCSEKTLYNYVDASSLISGTLICPAKSNIVLVISSLNLKLTGAVVFFHAIGQTYFIAIQVPLIKRVLVKPTTN